MVDREHIRSFASQIAELYAPSEIVLFGSYAYGTTTEDSDVDLLEVPLRWADGNGVEFTKLYRFRRGSYVVEVDF